jgi:GTPase SAR1 family protein
MPENQVWDTAGQEEFNALTKQYYRNANGCVLAFSTVDKDSYDAIENWKRKVEEVDFLPSQQTFASFCTVPRTITSPGSTVCLLAG